MDIEPYMTLLKSHYPLIVAAYVLVGIGLFGGYQNWSRRGRVLYVMAFPMHAVVFLCWQAIWSFIAGVIALAVGFVFVRWLLAALGLLD